MLILGYDRGADTLNLYNTKAFQALGVNGSYIAAWYQNQLWYPHMNPSLSFVVDGTEYKAGQLFASEQKNTYIEKRYQAKFTELDNKFSRLVTNTVYLASRAFTIDQEAGKLQITKRTLGAPENFHYFWLEAQEAPVAMADNTPLAPGGSNYPMRILAMDRRDSSLNLYNGAAFRALGADGYYVASWYNGKFYNAHMSPELEVTVNGKLYKAGELFDTEKSTFVEQRYKDYVAEQLTASPDGDALGDIVSPSHWDCMEGRQFSMFFDCLSRYEGRENLYRVTNSKGLTRNEYCLNYTPAADDTDFKVNVIRLDGETMAAAESKPVTVRVHHPLPKKLVKNICICGDSLVDCNKVATEVYRLLAEDGDCEVNQLGTRGSADGRHEGRGSWRWKDYLQGEDYAGKSNAFWDVEKGRLDFQKYCATNGYDGIGLCGPGADYSYLVNSSMGIFRKSMSTLNLALIKAFDEGAYKENATCFAHGLRTDRRLAFPYTDKAVTDRYEETSQTLTNSIHPSTRGYQAWAAGYYCQIRASTSLLSKMLWSKATRWNTQQTLV